MMTSKVPDTKKEPNNLLSTLNYQVYAQNASDNIEKIGFADKMNLQNAPSDSKNACQDMNLHLGNKLDNQVFDPWKSSGKRNSFKKTFPETLMSILDLEETDSAIKWDNSGESFTIVQPNTFTLVILPRYFKPTELSTFTRRLYWWGFKKVTKYGSEQHSFYHKMFKRGHHDLCKKIAGIKSCSKKRKLLKKVTMRNISMIAPKQQSTSQDSNSERDTITPSKDNLVLKLTELKCKSSRNKILSISNVQRSVLLSQLKQDIHNLQRQIYLMNEAMRCIQDH